MSGERIVLTVFLALAVGAWSTVCYAWVTDRQWKHRGMSIIAHAALRRHILHTDDRLQALLDYLQVEVTEPVVDDSPEAEAARVEDELDDAPTEEFPAITEPMAAVPARVDDVPLARVVAEIETDMRIHDVEMAWILAGFEDRIWNWQHDKEAAA